MNPKTDNTSPGNGNAVNANNDAAFGSTKKPNGWKPFLIFGIVVILGLVGVGWYIISNQGQERTDDAQVQSDVVAVAPLVEGQVVKVMITDNQQVKKGDPILKIDDSDFVARVTQAQGDLAIANAQLLAAESQEKIIAATAKGGLKSAGAGVTGSSEAVAIAESLIKSAQAALEKAESDAKKAESDLNRTRKLRESGIASQEELDNAQTVFDIAQASVSQAKANLAAAEKQKRAAESNVAAAEGKLTQSKSVNEQIAAAHAQTEIAIGRVKSAEAALVLAENQLEYTNLAAPADGIISELSVHPGQIVIPGMPVAELVPNESYLIANFKETQIGKMKPGDHVQITIDSYPGLKLDGEIESISGGTGAVFSILPPDNATGNFVKVVQRVPVRIRWINLPDGLFLRAGLSATAIVFVGERESKPL